MDLSNFFLFRYNCSWSSRISLEVAARCLQNPIFVLKQEYDVFKTFNAFQSSTPAEWTAAVHGVLLPQSSKTRLAEYVATGFHLEGLVEQIEADRADHIVGQGVELRLCLKELPQLGRFLLLLSLLLPSSSAVCAISPPSLSSQLLLLLPRPHGEIFISGGGLPAGLLRMIGLRVGLVLARVLLHLNFAAVARRLQLLDAAPSVR